MKQWFVWLQLFFVSKYFFKLNPKNWMLNFIKHDDFRFFFFRYPIWLFPCLKIEFNCSFQCETSRIFENVVCVSRKWKAWIFFLKKSCLKYFPTWRTMTLGASDWWTIVWTSCRKTSRCGKKFVSFVRDFIIISNKLENPSSHSAFVFIYRWSWSFLERHVRFWASHRSFFHHAEMT
jgi:hypothetical protein